MAPFYISVPKELGMLITIILRSLPATKKVYTGCSTKTPRLLSLYNGLEVTRGTVTVQVNQEETKVMSQSRIGKDVPNGMGQSKFESLVSTD
jgi:hypothetical protein